MKVLLLHLPFEHELAQDYTGDSLGLGYIASVLRRDGHEVEMLDALIRNLKPGDVAREIVERSFDCIGITANHYHQNVLISTVREIRKHKKDVPIIIGGYLPTLSTAELLTKCPEIDIAVLGEGETTISDLIGRLDRSEDWHSIDGIAYMSDDGLVVTPSPSPITDLDTLPFPARDAIIQAQQVRPVELIRVLGSRGCYHRCSFCCIHAFYAFSGSPNPRMRQPEKVIEEIESTIAATGIKRFRFSDDDFIGPSPKTREHALQIAEELKKSKLPITFDIECRADVLDEDVLKQLKEVGLDEVFLGIESGSQTQLDRFNKRTTVEQNREAIRMLENLGIRVSSGFIMFDPYVTLAELSDNLQFLNDTGIGKEVDTSTPGRKLYKGLSKLAIFPGVPLHERLKADGLVTKDGMNIEYKYKDRSVRILCGAVKACWVISHLPEYLKSLVNRQK